MAEHQSMIERAAPAEQPKTAAEPMTSSMQAPSPPPLPVDEIGQTDAAATVAIISEPLLALGLARARPTAACGDANARSIQACRRIIRWNRALQDVGLVFVRIDAFVQFESGRTLYDLGVVARGDVVRLELFAE